VPALTICLFGPFEVQLNGAPLPRPRSRKGLWLLALLTLRHGREVERDWLAGTLWPESAPAQAFHSLNMSLTDLRRALGPEAGRLCSPTRRTLCLDLAGVAADVVAFDAAIARGDGASLETAVALYRGPLLEACAEEWAFSERQAREQAYLRALETLAAQARAAGDPGGAERWLRQAVVVDPLRETAQRDLMRVLVAGGNYAAAAQVYRDLRLRLHREVNTAPDPETTALFQQLRAEARGQAVAPPSASFRASSSTSGSLLPTPGVPELAEEFPAFPSLAPGAALCAAVSHNLPLQLTRFVGREPELAAVKERLSTLRLVTLTGPGGCGKTRLALQIAADQLDCYADGVCLVELAPLRDPSLVLPTVAAVFAVREELGRPLLIALTEFLRARSLLLLLDNFEQVAAAAPQVLELLTAAPRLTVLTTSRAPLRLRGEQEFPVPPLALPPVVRGSGQVPEPSTLSQYAAVELFCQRARDVQPDFALTSENAAAVAAICQRLDGLPLAIELAAMRIKLLSPAALLSRLERRLPLLTGGARDLPARQQTLRDAIAWSYDLLTAEERQLFRRLSVFVGGFSLEAAEAVCSDCGLRIADCGLADNVKGGPVFDVAPNPQSGDPQSAIRNEEVLDGIASLVDKSLLRQQDSSLLPRFTMLETVREYGQERLEASGEAPAVRRQHVSFFCQLAEEGSAYLGGVPTKEWLDRLDAEHDNLRAALQWSIESGGVKAGLRLALSLWGWWDGRNHYAEAREWLKRLLEMNGDAPAALRARVLNEAGHLAGKQGDYATAQAFLKQGLALARELGDKQAIANSLEMLGGAAAEHRGDLLLGRALLEESLAIYRELDDPWGLVWAIHELGRVARRLGDFTTAQSAFEESLARFRELGYPSGPAWSLINLGVLAHRRGQLDAARSLYQESLTICWELEEKWGIAEGFGSLAALAGSLGEAERAARLWGAAEALRERIGSPRPDSARGDYNTRIADARARLGEAAFAAAWAAGRALPLKEAVAYALEEAARE
jgi:predicted ATPase/DNA-binding SARP family transcriptional activator